MKPEDLQVGQQIRLVYEGSIVDRGYGGTFRPSVPDAFGFGLQRIAQAVSIEEIIFNPKDDPAGTLRRADLPTPGSTYVKIGPNGWVLLFDHPDAYERRTSTVSVYTDEVMRERDARLIK